MTDAIVPANEPVTDNVDVIIPGRDITQVIFQPNTTLRDVLIKASVTDLSGLEVRVNGVPATNMLDQPVQPGSKVIVTGQIRGATA